MYDIVTIGDAMKDIFVFPAAEEMEKPVTGAALHHSDKNERFLLFGYGEKITISDIHYDIGGSACNVAAGLAKLSLKTGIISKVGQDSEGKEIIERLKKAKVDINLIETDSEKKTSFSVIISYKGERSILVFHSFTPTDFEIPKKLETKWLYTGPLGENYKSLYGQITALAAEKNVNIAVNPGAVQIHDGVLAMAGLLRVAKILFINKEEGQKLAEISGTANVKDIVRTLKKTGVETIVITDGQNGAYAARGEDEFFKVGVYPGERIEATGAGDSFASAFLAAQIQGLDLYNSLKWGVVNSASVVGKVGAQDGLLSAAAIKKRIREYKWPASSLRFS